MSILDFLQGGTPKDRFAQKVIRRAKARGWAGPAPDYVRQPYSLRFSNEHTLFLDNCFAAWNKSPPADKDRQIDILLGILFEPRHGDRFDTAAPCLLPAVRNRSHLTNAWLTPGLDKSRGVYDGAMQPMGEDLVVVAVIDTEMTIGYVTQGKLTDWGMALEPVLATALTNLRAISPCKFVREPQGFWISNYGDHHDTARLLLPHLFEQLDLRGEPVAIPLDRAALLVAGADDTAALNAMAAFAEEKYPTLDRPIACAPMVLRQGHWTRFETGAPDLAALNRLGVIQSCRDYAEQKAQLEARHKAEGVDLFVATLDTIGRDGWLETWTTWAVGVDTLLPRADVVVFARRVDERFEQRPRCWAEVETAFGPFTAEPDLYPPRYRLRDWPDGAWERAEPLRAPAWAKA